MHLITCCKNGSLPALPQILPPGLYDAASGRPPTRNGPDRRQPGRAMPPVPPIPKQFSGPQAQRAQSPLSRNFTPPVPQNANAIQRDITGGGWAVSAADKERFDQVFMTVDKANRGVITGMSSRCSIISKYNK
jgi:epidermal growth factor receptor substrate 15